MLKLNKLECILGNQSLSFFGIFLTFSLFSGHFVVAVVVAENFLPSLLMLKQNKLECVLGYNSFSSF